MIFIQCMTEFSTNLMILYNYYMFALPHFSADIIPLTLLLVLMFVLPGEAYFVTHGSGQHTDAVNTGYLCEKIVDAQQNSEQCPMTDTIISDVVVCTRYAQENNMPYAGLAGPTWEAGCIVNGGSVYFSDPAVPRTSSNPDQTDGGSICLTPLPAFDIAPVEGWNSGVELSGADQCITDGPNNYGECIRIHLAQTRRCASLCDPTTHSTFLRQSSFFCPFPLIASSYTRKKGAELDHRAQNRSAQRHFVQTQRQRGSLNGERNEVQDE